MTNKERILWDARCSLTNTLRGYQRDDTGANARKHSLGRDEVVVEGKFRRDLVVTT